MSITTNHELVLSKLSLPNEVLKIIKDFAYDDEITANSKKYKNMFVYKIYNSIYNSNVVLHVDYGVLVYVTFIIKSNEDFIHFKCIYCSKCGEKLLSAYMNRICRCEPLAIEPANQNAGLKSTIIGFSKDILSIVPLLIMALTMTYIMHSFCVTVFKYINNSKIDL